MTCPYLSQPDGPILCQLWQELQILTYETGTTVGETGTKGGNRYHIEGGGGKQVPKGETGATVRGGNRCHDWGYRYHGEGGKKVQR